MKSTYNKKCTPRSLNSNKKPRNFCVNLQRKTKIDYFSNRKIKDFFDNRIFCKATKSYFSNERQSFIYRRRYTY